VTLLTRVILIVVLALLPAVGVELYNEHARRTAQEAQFRADALHEARTLSAGLDRVVAGVRDTMIAVTALPAVRDGDAACGPLLHVLQQRFTSVGVLALVGSDSRLACDSDGDASAADLSERPSVRLARERRGFVTAGYVLGRVTRRPELAMGLPLDPDAGMRSPVLVMNVDLDWLKRQVGTRQHLPDPVVLVADSAGTTLVSLPGATVGQSIPAQGLALMHTADSGVLDMTGPDGVRRLFGYVPLSRASNNLFVAVGFSDALAEAGGELAFRRTLALLAGGLALGLGGAVLLARRAVGWPVAAILATIAAWRAGDAGARVAPHAVARAREFSEISAALNELLAAFERTRATLQEREDALTRRVAERTTQLEQEVREREQAQALLQQAQKMEVIGQLTGGVAHDFNNLLTAIVGNLELARRRSTADPAVTRLLANATRAADRGAALTQRMLAFGRRQYLSLTPIPAAELLVGMEDLLARTIDAKIRIELDLADDLWWIRGDRNQIELMVLNLAINARDAMPHGGLLVIAARNFTLSSAAPAHPASLSPRDYVAFSLTDTGTGMDEATLERALDPFFTTKPVGKGSGLGLSMAQGIAAQSGGGLTIDSVLGRGTTVRIWLPRAEPSATPAETASDGQDLAMDARARVGMVVLVVEDDAEVAEFAQQCLLDEGFSVLRAGDGQSALAIIEAASRVDVMVADLAMPGMNGLQLATEARRRLPRLPVLLATGYADADSFDGGEAGLPILEKPFKAAQLVAAVAALLPLKAAARLSNSL